MCCITDASSLIYAHFKSIQKKLQTCCSFVYIASANLPFDFQILNLKSLNLCILNTWTPYNNHSTNFIMAISTSDPVYLATMWGHGFRVQPSHTMTHPLLSSRQHDFVVVMATTAVSYLTNLPWDKVDEMKEKGLFSMYVYVWLCANCCQTWAVLDRQQRSYVIPTATGGHNQFM